MLTALMMIDRQILNQLRALVREYLESHMDQRKLRALKLAEEERRGLAQIDKLLGGAA